jgi:hypothetical protein
MVRNKVLNTILLVSDEAMPNDLHDEVPSRLLSLFKSPVIGRDDIVYPDFVGEDVDVPLDSIGEFRDPIPRCTAFAFRSDWQDVDNDLEIAYVKNNDTPERIVSLIGMYSEHSSIYPSLIKSLFDDTFWEELPVMTHETFRFYMENLGMYVAMLAIPDLGEKYNTKISLSTAGFKEWCSIMDSELAKL